MLADVLEENCNPAGENELIFVVGNFPYNRKLILLFSVNTTQAQYSAGKNDCLVVFLIMFPRKPCK